MNPLLKPEVQDFIRQNENANETALLLRKQPIYGVSASLVAQQIIGRRKAKQKIQQYYDTPSILYPSPVYLEQSSSQATAAFKASKFLGQRAVDLTGGFGVDCFFLSKSFSEASYVEPNSSLFEIALHNHRLLQANNITHFNTTAEAFLESSAKPRDLLYLDPSRRNNLQGRVFRFSQCQPNVLDLLPSMLKIAKQIVIKASPLHDIQLGIKELNMVSAVFVIAVNNECKELLFVLRPDKSEDVSVEAVDLDPLGNTRHRFSSHIWEEEQASCEYSQPAKYLYEPSAAVLKAGAFKLIAQRFGVAKLATNTHLYTSNKIIEDFPGKVFEVVTSLKANPKSFREFLPDNKANIITRNYPLTNAALKKKLKVNDGGEKFIIGCSGESERYLLLATKVLPTRSPGKQ
ncbi:MAG: hypothetical protein RLN86_08995 [Cyclobacteriaceae bacterium]